jgi:hypothetical protein
MEKFINDHMADLDVLDNPSTIKNSPFTSEQVIKEKECEIEKGNLEDYLEIFGDMEDIN